MSVELTGVEAALYGGLGGGLVGGILALLGVVVERLLRLTGRVRFEGSGWDVELRIDDGQGSWYLGSLEEADDSAKVVGLRYTASIDLFNGKEVPTGLRDARVVLICADGKRIESRPFNLETHPRNLNVINISPLQFSHLELRGEDFGKDAADAFNTGRWKRIEFVAERPRRPIFGILGSKTYRKTITEP